MSCVSNAQQDQGFVRRQGPPRGLQHGGHEPSRKASLTAACQMPRTLPEAPFHKSSEAVRTGRVRKSRHRDGSGPDNFQEARDGGGSWRTRPCLVRLRAHPCSGRRAEKPCGDGALGRGPKLRQFGEPTEPRVCRSTRSCAPKNSPKRTGRHSKPMTSAAFGRGAEDQEAGDFREFHAPQCNPHSAGE